MRKALLLILPLATSALVASSLSLPHENFNGMPGQYLPKPAGRRDFTGESIKSRVELAGG